MAGALNISPKKVFSVVHSPAAATIGTDTVIFTAPHPCFVLAASEVHATAGNDVGAVSLQLTKDTGTDAPGAGTDLLANNTNVGFDLKGTANTVQNAEFKTTAGILALNKGDRLAIDYAGTTTALAGVNVTIWLYSDIDG